MIIFYPIYSFGKLAEIYDLCPVLLQIFTLEDQIWLSQQKIDECIQLEEI